MPRAKKKITSNSGPPRPSDSENESLEPWENTGREKPTSRKEASDKPGARKRGWRDIEAIRERARLKKMLVDIWHEDIELDEDIFGGTEHLKNYYSGSIEEAVIEIEDADPVDSEDFDETEE